MRPFATLSQRLPLYPWYSVWFRYLALWIAKHPFLSCLLTLSGLLTLDCAILMHSLPKIGLVPVGLLYLLREFLAFINSLSFFSILGLVVRCLGYLFVAWLVILLGLWIFKSRKRIYVAPFEDHTGNVSMKGLVSGFAPMLLNTLSRIRQLHEDVDESGALVAGDGNGSKPTAAISLQDPGQTLQQAFTSDQKLKFFGLEISVGAIVGLLGRLAQGPRLSGSIHLQTDAKKLDQISVIARIEGPGFPAMEWRVNSQDIDYQTTDNLLVDGLIEQLAYRIFTDIVDTGAKRWTAVYSFTKGLESLRIITRTDNDRFYNLRQAERNFIQALAEDSKFATCHYNLGVVYDKLGLPTAAAASYRTAIEKKPVFGAAYYALALGHWNSGPKTTDAERAEDLRQCILLCERSVSLDPQFARAWNLHALAYRKMKKTAKKPKELKESNESRRIAAAVAWRALCKSTLLGGTDKGARGIAADCLRSLAVGHASSENRFFNPHARAIFRQALYLKPADSDIRFEFSKVLYADKRYKDAVAQLKAVTSCDPRPEHWAWLAKAQQMNGDDNDDVRESLRRALLNFACNDDTIRQIQEVPDFYQDAKIMNAARRCSSILNILPDEENSGDSGLMNYLGRMQGIVGADKKDWGFSDIIPKLDWETAPLEKAIQAVKGLPEKEILETAVDTMQEAIRAAVGPLNKAVGSVSVASPTNELVDALIESNKSAIKGTTGSIQEAVKVAKDLLEKVSEAEPDSKKKVKMKEVAFLLNGALTAHEPEVAVVKFVADSLTWEIINAAANSLQKSATNEATAKAASFLKKVEIEKQSGSASAEVSRQTAAKGKSAIKAASDSLIREKGLYGILALAFNATGDCVRAQRFAERAVSLNPTRSWERSILASIYSAIGDNDRAEVEFQNCFNLAQKGEQQLSLTSIASTYVDRGVFQLKSGQRNELFDKAIEFYDRLLKVLENQPLSSDTKESKQHLQAIGSTHFWCGRLYLDRRLLDKAISEFRKAAGHRYQPLETKFHRGSTYFEAGSYQYADDTFGEVIAEVSMIPAQANPEDSLTDESMPTKELLARAYLGQALTRVERGCSTDLHDAQDLLQRGRELLPDVEAGSQSPKARPESKTAPRELKALSYEIEGCIKQLTKGNTEAAEAFDKSISCLIEPRCCVRLVETYLALSAGVKDDEGRAALLSRARKCCDLARTADVLGAYEDRISQLLARIDGAK